MIEFFFGRGEEEEKKKRSKCRPFFSATYLFATNTTRSDCWSFWAVVTRSRIRGRVVTP
jgi:hypothetical protein